MNIAVIFAGGVGKRMGQTEKPKQFLEVLGKPIIIHTLEVFDKSDEIDAIIVSCIEDWIEHLKELLEKYEIKKVKKIVQGGKTGQMSIFNGLNAAMKLYSKDSVVLIHDGVRPFIDDNLIRRNIDSVKEQGSAISCVMSVETFVLTDENNKIERIPKRVNSLVAKAPQSFVLDDIYQAHIKAQKEGIFDSIDSCTLMNKYNNDLHIVMTDYDNIKITTQKDLSLAESIFKRKLIQ
mgnify:CR=1 FL=1